MLKKYYEGYSMGINPFRHPILQRIRQFMLDFSQTFRYERMDVSAGIPKRIVTDKVLEDFLLLECLGCY
jgi:arylamine N-acetyltransferase